MMSVIIGVSMITVFWGAPFCRHVIIPQRAESFNVKYLLSPFGSSFFAFLPPLWFLVASCYWIQRINCLIIVSLLGSVPCESPSHLILTATQWVRHFQHRFTGAEIAAHWGWSSTWVLVSGAEGARGSPLSGDHVGSTVSALQVISIPVLSHNPWWNVFSLYPNWLGNQLVNCVWIALSSSGFGDYLWPPRHFPTVS